MRFNPKSIILAALVAVAAVLAVLPQASAVSMKSGSPFLYDDNDRIVGVKDPDGAEYYFARYPTAAAASATNPASTAITGGTINGATIGATTPAAATVTTLASSSTTYLATAGGNVAVGTDTFAAFAGYSGITANNSNGSFVHLRRAGVTRIKLEATPVGNYLSTAASQGALILAAEDAPVLTLVPSGVGLTGYIEGTEQTAPAAPPSNGYRIFAQDNGSGKTQLMVIFATGAAQQIAIQP